MVTLKSGGYIVINQAEALVAIDVNSGRATRERNIEQTAVKTNLEAADEAARQMRLRDLAGLIVIDFIDMEESKNDRAVEKRMKDNLRFDRARVQMGKISGFGLLELSRQRRRTGVLEGTSHVCEHCQGAGRVRSAESAALALFRALDETAAKQSGHMIEARASTDVALYLLNEKREAIANLEHARKVRVRVSASANLNNSDFELNAAAELAEDEMHHDAEIPRAPVREEAPEPEVEDDVADEVEDVDSESAEAEGETEARADAGDGDSRRRRRRGRRGGRRRREDGDAAEAPHEEAPQPVAAVAASAEERGRRRRRRGRGRSRRVYEVDGGEWLDFVAADLKHLTPRPERPERQPRQETRAAAADPVELPPPPELEAEPRPHTEPTLVAVASTAPEETPAAIETAPPAEPYEPDQERRDKFLSRFSRWAKKSG
jgi:ribonuclease E